MRVREQERRGQTGDTPRNSQGRFQQGIILAFVRARPICIRSDWTPRLKEEICLRIRRSLSKRSKARRCARTPEIVLAARRRVRGRSLAAFGPVDGEIQELSSRSAAIHATRQMQAARSTRVAAVTLERPKEVDWKEKRSQEHIGQLSVRSRAFQDSSLVSL